METKSINTIKENPNNPRVIKDDKFKKLVQSLKDFPEMSRVRPIVVNADMVVLGGNMRLKAMHEAGWTDVPVEVVDWPEEKQKEFIIKDNIGYGEWEWESLANEWDAVKLEEWGLDLPGYNVDPNQLTDGFSLPDGDKAPVQQMTFTLADAQAERIKEALKSVEVQDGTQYGNENSNGNALHQIILEWDEQRR